MEQAFVVKWSNGSSEMKVVCKESGLRQLAGKLGNSQFLQVSLADCGTSFDEPRRPQSSSAAEKTDARTADDATTGAHGVTPVYPSVDAIFETPPMFDAAALGSTFSIHGAGGLTEWAMAHEQREPNARLRRVARYLLVTALFIITPLSAFVALG